MMQNVNRKNLFDDYGAEPSPLVWEKIQGRLPAPGNRKRAWMAWTVAAVLLTGLFLSSYLFDIKITLKKRNITEKISPSANQGGQKKNKEAAAEKNQTPVAENSSSNNASQKETAVTEKNAPGKTATENTMVASAGRNKVKSNSRIENKTTATAAGIAIADEKNPGENKTEVSEASPIVVNETAVNEKRFIENAPSLGLPLASVDSMQMLRAMLIDFQPVKKKYSVSRWQWSAVGSSNYNYRVLTFPDGGNNPVNEGEKNYLAENETGIRAPAFETEVGYSFSTHFDLSFGVHYFTAGQERTQADVVLSSGFAGTPGTQYAVSTSAGVVAADGQQVDYAVLNSNDTSLFTQTLAIAGPNTPDSVTVQYITMRQEFSFIGFPLIIQYQPAEHRFTPFVGLGLSAGYLLKERVTLNGKELDYSYQQNANDIMLFAEARAGVKYRISNHLFFKLQPSLRYGLNSLSGDNNVKWIPYSTGIGAGINLKF